MENAKSDSVTKALVADVSFRSAQVHEQRKEVPFDLASHPSEFLFKVAATVDSARGVKRL